MRNLSVLIAGLFGVSIIIYAAFLLVWQSNSQPARDAMSSQESGTKSIIALYTSQFSVNGAENNEGRAIALKELKGIGNSLFGFPSIRPYDAYRYDVRRSFFRRRQARVAKHYGISGFMYQYRWQENRPKPSKSNEALDLVLHDGEPNIDFCILWATEGNQAWLEKGNWLNHFDTLLLYFKHPRYMRREGRPILAIDNLRGLSPMESMLKSWQKLAKEAGLSGLFIIDAGTTASVNGVKHKAAHAVMDPMPGAVSVARNMSRNRPSPRYERILTVGTSFNNQPKWRSLKDGVTVRPAHPVAFKRELRTVLDMTPRGGMVVVSAWNNWEEGMAVEPSHEFGVQWLQAIQAAKEEGDRKSPIPHFPAVGLPVPPPPDTGNMCLVVRTFSGHADGSMYSLRDFLTSIFHQENQAITVLLFNTDQAPFHELRHIVDSSYADFRSSGASTQVQVKIVQAPVERAYSSYYSSYDVTDWVIAKHVVTDGSKCTFFAVTNGDNFYSPDAFNVVPGPNENMVLMNFHGRYSLVNSITYDVTAHAKTRKIRDGKALDDRPPSPDCCSRLKGYTCMDTLPTTGYIDLGAVIFKASDWVLANLHFSAFHGACQKNSCHDGALVKYVVQDLQWKYSQHPSGMCALLHNPNPVSCKLVGGYYYDAPTFADAGCYASPYDTGLSDAAIDWAKFIAHDGCVCSATAAHVLKQTTDLNKWNFDGASYISKYPDVASKYGAKNAFEHYVKSGRTEGRDGYKKDFH